MFSHIDYFHVIDSGANLISENPKALYMSSFNGQLILITATPTKGTGWRLTATKWILYSADDLLILIANWANLEERWQKWPPSSLFSDTCWFSFPPFRLGKKIFFFPFLSILVFSQRVCNVFEFSCFYIYYWSGSYEYILKPRYTTQFIYFCIHNNHY